LEKMFKAQTTQTPVNDYTELKGAIDGIS